MAQRESDDRIKQLYAQGIVPYSISRLNAIDGCLKEAYYTYVKNMKSQGKANIYGIMGGRVHEVLEQIYNNNADGSALLPALNKDLESAELLGVDFPRDFKGGTSIRDNWIADMRDFCEKFEKLPGEFSTEELVILKVSDTRYLIGYIDLIQIVDEEKKEVKIFDFKTSSKFKKEDLKHHGRQLIVYGTAMEQAGYKVLDLAWIMLKYVEVKYQGYLRANSKNKTTISKVVSRGKLAKELFPQVEDALYDAGYDEIETEIIISQFKEANSMSVLPEEIQKQFEVTQYIEHYPFSEANKQETLDYINEKADQFEYLQTLGDDVWKPVEITKKESFYCNNLCNYRELCPHIKAYNDLIKLENAADEDLF